MAMNGATARLASEINITPMIDVLLVLLIIFMLIVPATSKGEATLVPRSASLVKAVEQEFVVLEVLKGSAGAATLRINQRAISWAELPARLGAIYARRAQRGALRER
jgi:biopolymer transport protein ExbD